MCPNVYSYLSDQCQAESCIDRYLLPYCTTQGSVNKGNVFGIADAPQNVFMYNETEVSAQIEHSQYIHKISFDSSKSCDAFL